MILIPLLLHALALLALGTPRRISEQEWRAVVVHAPLRERITTLGYPGNVTELILHGPVADPRRQTVHGSRYTANLDGVCVTLYVPIEGAAEADARWCSAPRH